MRDLRADLNAIKAFTDDRMIYDVAKEWIERAIKAEEIVKKYATAARVIALYLKEYCDPALTYDEMIAEASRRADSQLSALREDSELQRASIQDLSQQVVRLQAVADTAKRLYEICADIPIGFPGADRFVWTMRDLKDALSELEVTP